MFNYAEAPDTFVECYVKDSTNDKIRQKKKTDIIRQNMNPDYNYTVTYSVSSSKLWKVHEITPRHIFRWATFIVGPWYSLCYKEQVAMKKASVIMILSFRKFMITLLTH